MLSGAYRFPLMESVIFGKPYVEALAGEVDRLEARAVFVLASGTLARDTDLVERLRQCSATASPTSVPRLARIHRAPMSLQPRIWRARQMPI